MRNLAELDKAHVWHPFTQHAVWNAAEPLIIERAEGNWLIDVEGRRYLDGVSSLWTNVHGHRHPKIDEAIRRQLDKVAHSTLLGLTHPTAIELAARLVRIAPPGLEKVFYSDSGATSVEVALKMAFQYHQQTGNPQRTRFAALRDAYHGDTIGAVSVGSVDLFHAVYKPLLFDAIALPAPVTPGGDEEEACLRRALAILEEHGRELAAFVFEPLVQGAAGMKMHSPRFLRTLCERARELGVLLVADEVAVGFGRLGTMFAMEQVGVSPDFLCLAKGISGGYLPLAATLATQAVYDGFLGAPTAYKQLFHGHTYTGNPLACAAGLASLDVFEEEHVLARVSRSEQELAVLFGRLRTQAGVTGIRHKGVMAGIDVEGPPGTGHAVAMACRPRGAITRPLGNTLVLNPPLSLEGADLTRLVEIVSDAIADVVATV
jgi:adenosylmethionine-8-amino-7-oxononanoate aminotransferase